MFDSHLSPVPQKKLDRLDEVLRWLCEMVRSGFCCGGDRPTVADLSLMASYASLRRCDVVDLSSKYRMAEAWFNR